MRILLSSVLLAGFAVGCGALLGLDDESTGSPALEAGSGSSGTSGGGSGTSGGSGSSGTEITDSGGGGSSGTVDQDGAPSPIAATIGEGDAVLAAGTGHTCVVTEMGTVKCWGRAEIVGRESDSSQPVDIAGLDQVTALASGDDFVCALRADRSVWCWGVAGLAVLGGPGSAATPHAIDPVPPDVVSLTAGRAHACLLAGSAGNARVFCWGAGAHGRLGSGNTNNITSPKQVELVGELPPLAVAAGAEFSCSLHTNGQVQCWGRNERLQLATGTGATSTTAVATQLAIQGVQISAGRDFACVRGPAATARCWGDNSAKQLTSSSTDQLPPTEPPQNDLSTIEAGDRHVCFRLNDGAIVCSGLQEDGRTGPPAIAGTYDLVAAGNDHTCLARRPSTIECFGGNGSGQLGRSGGGGPTPLRVAGY